MVELQRMAGNRATTAALQREPVQDAAGTVTGHRFEVGKDVSATVAAAAKAAAGDGVVDTADLIRIRTSALAGDESVNDNERLFMAALLDAANARALNARSFGPGDPAIEFPAASITAARRSAVDAAGRAAMPADVLRMLGLALDELGDLDFGAAWAHLTDAERAAVRGIATVTGPFAATAGEALAVARGAGMPAVILLAGMLAAASDGTPGDVAMAGVVIAIAQAERHPLVSDLLAGNVNVDEVPAASMPGGPDHLADYVTVAQGSGAKGDTIYLPPTFSIANAYHWSVVVHELQHAVDDKAAGGGNVQMIDRARAELGGYRAQGASIMRKLATDPTAAAEIGAEWNDLVLLGMVLESRGDAAAADPLITAVNTAAPAARQIAPALLTRVLGTSVAKLETAALAAISNAYGITAGTSPPVAPADGLAGESIIDWIDRI